MPENWILEFAEFYDRRKKDPEALWESLSNASLTVRYRNALLLLGVFLPREDPAHTVNQWLFAAGFPRLSFRNPEDCVFLYAYRTVKGLTDEETLAAVKKLFDEHCEREDRKEADRKARLKDLRQKRASTPPREASRLEQQIREIRAPFPPVETFGDLHRVLALNSTPSAARTMGTATSTPYWNQRLTQLAAQGKSLTEFMEALEQDPAMAAFNQQATYYAQKMLYDLLKYTPDLLFFHRIPEEEPLKTQYEEAVKAALQNNQNFNRFLNYNHFYLDGIKDGEFRLYCMEQKEFARQSAENAEHCVSLCITQYLEDCPISYRRLLSGLHSLFIYNFTHSLTARKEGRSVRFAAAVSEETYFSIFGEKPDFRATMASRLAGFMDGTFLVGREFLILLGFFAGYSEARLNRILERCDFAPLEKDPQIAPFDAVIHHHLLENFPAELRHAVNQKNFICKMRDNPQHMSAVAIFGEEERDRYDTLLTDFQSAMHVSLDRTDKELLSGLFEKRPEIHEKRKQRLDTKKINGLR